MASISGISNAASGIVSQAVSSGSSTIATCTVCGQTPCVCSDSDTATGTSATAAPAAPAAATASSSSSSSATYTNADGDTISLSTGTVVNCPHGGEHKGKSAASVESASDATKAVVSAATSAATDPSGATPSEDASSNLTPLSQMLAKVYSQAP